MPQRQGASFYKGGIARSRRRRGYGWKPGTDWKIRTLGSCGEALMAHVLQGELLPHGSQEADIFIPGSDAGVEVKTCSHRDGPRLKKEQFLRQLGLARAGFPFAHFWHAFIRYQNLGMRDPDREIGRLFQAEVRSEEQIPAFLREHIQTVYLFDIRVLDAIRRKRGFSTSLVQRDGPIPAVGIGWRFFDLLSINPSRAFRELSLNPWSYDVESRWISTWFRGRVFEFELRVVVHRWAASGLRRQIKASLAPRNV